MSTIDKETTTNDLPHADEVYVRETKQWSGDLGLYDVSATSGDDTVSLVTLAEDIHFNHARQYALAILAACNHAENTPGDVVEVSRSDLPQADEIYVDGTRAWGSKIGLHAVVVTKGSDMLRFVSLEQCIHFEHARQYALAILGACDYAEKSKKMDSTERLEEAIGAAHGSHACKVPQVAELASAARQYMHEKKDLTLQIVRTQEELLALDRDTAILVHNSGYTYLVRKLTQSRVRISHYVPAAIIATGDQVRAARKALGKEND